MIRVFKQKNGDWRWNAKAGGRIVAESGEGYRRRSYCVRAACKYGPAGMHVRVGNPDGTYGYSIHKMTR